MPMVETIEFEAHGCRGFVVLPSVGQSADEEPLDVPQYGKS
jgi:hypothetical protein